MEDKYGLMDRFMKECSRIIWLMDLEDLFIPMEIITKGNGLMISQTVEEYSNIQMVVGMLESGFRIINTVMV